MFVAENPKRPIAEAPVFCVVPLWITAIGCLALFLYADRLYAMLAPIVK